MKSVAMCWYCRYLYNGRHRHREHTWGRIGGEGPIAIEAKWLDDTYRTPTKARRHMRKVGTTWRDIFAG